MKTNRRLRLAVLISGTGSNLKALIDAIGQGRLNASIAAVISNRADAHGLRHARAAHIPCTVIDSSGCSARKALDDGISECLEAVDPDLVVLAGYMRILGPEVVRRFLGKMINLHPSLLPKFPGLNTYERAIAAGEQHHGSSIHFVTEGLDDGPLISQVVLAIHSADTPQTLASRLGPLEHQLIVATVQLFAHRDVRMIQDHIEIDGEPLRSPLVFDIQSNEFF